MFTCHFSRLNVPCQWPCYMLGLVIGFALHNIIINALIHDKMFQNHETFHSVHKWLNIRWISCVTSAGKLHSHLHEVTTCGIWEAVPLRLLQSFLKCQGCWNRAFSHSDSSFRNAEESPNKDTTRAVGTMPLLLSSEKMSCLRSHWLNLAPVIKSSERNLSALRLCGGEGLSEMYVTSKVHRELMLYIYIYIYNYISVCMFGCLTWPSFGILLFHFCILFPKTFCPKM